MEPGPLRSSHSPLRSDVCGHKHSPGDVPNPLRYHRAEGEGAGLTFRSTSRNWPVTSGRLDTVYWILPSKPSGTSAGGRDVVRWLLQLCSTELAPSRLCLDLKAPCCWQRGCSITASMHPARPKGKAE